MNKPGNEARQLTPLSLPAATVSLKYSDGAVRERSALPRLPSVVGRKLRGRAGMVGVGEWPSGGLGALSIGNWAHMRAHR